MYANSIVVLALAAIASAQTPTPSPSTGAVTPTGQSTVVATTTKVVDTYVTYCPAPTTFHMGGKKYEVKNATTLTITDCPCTIVEPCHTCQVGQPTLKPSNPGAIPSAPPAVPGKPASPGNPAAPPAGPGNPVAPPAGPGNPVAPPPAASTPATVVSGAGKQTTGQLLLAAGAAVAGVLAL